MADFAGNIATELLPYLHGNAGVQGFPPGRGAKGLKTGGKYLKKTRTRTGVPEGSQAAGSEPRLLRNTEPVRLRSKVFDALRALVENHGRLVGAESLACLESF